MKVQDNSKGWPEGWLVAAAAAVFAAVMARVVGDMGLFGTLMIALFVFLVFGVLLGLFWGGATSSAHGHAHPAGPGHADGHHGHAHDHKPAAEHAPQMQTGSAPVASAAPLASTSTARPAAPDFEPEVLVVDPASSAVMSSDPAAQAMSLAEPLPQATGAESSLPEPGGAAQLPSTDAPPDPAVTEVAAQSAEVAAQGPQSEATEMTTSADAGPSDHDAAILPDADPDAQASSPMPLMSGTVEPGTHEPAQAVQGDDDSDSDDSMQAEPGTGAPRRTKAERIAARAAKAERQAAKAATAESPKPAAAAAEVQPASVVDLPMADAREGGAKEGGPKEVGASDGGTKPQGLSAARGGQADALQTIEGIGPVLEKLCHELGIYHFDQIAGWGAAEIAWMDGNLKGFKGRVTRDKWVRQAALIGQVGIDEFLRRAKTNDY